MIESASENGTITSSNRYFAKYSHAIMGPARTVSISAVDGHLNIGRSLCLPNASTTPIPSPSTPPAVARTRFTNSPPHSAGSSPLSIQPLSTTESGGSITKSEKKNVKTPSRARYLLSLFIWNSSDLEQYLLVIKKDARPMALTSANLVMGPSGL